MAVHRAMFNLVTHGRGGWTYDVVYNLPLHLRAFYIGELVKLVGKEQAAINQMAPKNSNKHFTPKGT